MESKLRIEFLSIQDFFFATAQVFLVMAKIVQPLPMYVLLTADLPPPREIVLVKTVRA